MSWPVACLLGLTSARCPWRIFFSVSLWSPPKVKWHQQKKKKTGKHCGLPEKTCLVGETDTQHTSLKFRQFRITFVVWRLSSHLCVWLFPSESVYPTVHLAEVLACNCWTATKELSQGSDETSKGEPWKIKWIKRKFLAKPSNSILLTVYL